MTRMEDGAARAAAEAIAEELRTEGASRIAKMTSLLHTFRASDGAPVEPAFVREQLQLVDVRVSALDGTRFSVAVWSP